MCADVYGAPPHTGRGGWTWYTGSAGWLYRVGLEAILGFRLARRHALTFEPCVPPDWPGYEMTYRHRSATYHIGWRTRPARAAASGPSRWTGSRAGRRRCRCMDDGQTHDVRVELG